MSARLKQLILSNAVMIVCSLVLGYSLWYMLSSNRVIQETIQLPLTIIDQQGTPLRHEIVTVQLEGTHQALQTVVQQPPHPLITTASEQKSIAITKSDLLMPHTVHIQAYTPTNISL